MTRAPDRRLRMHALGLVLLAVAATLPGPTRAQADPQASAPARLRPTGPVTLSADRAVWVQGGDMQYQGNVSLKADTLELQGDRMSVAQAADGQFSAQIFGTPARLKHLGQAGTDGPAAQPVNAEAERIDYDAREGVIRLSGNARLLRGGDEVTGAQIDYLVAARRIQASGGDSGQVRIVIQPPPMETPP